MHRGFNPPDSKRKPPHLPADTSPSLRNLKGRHLGVKRRAMVINLHE